MLIKKIVSFTSFKMCVHTTHRQSHTYVNYLYTYHIYNSTIHNDIPKYILLSHDSAHFLLVPPCNPLSFPSNSSPFFRMLLVYSLNPNSYACSLNGTRIFSNSHVNQCLLGKKSIHLNFNSLAQTGSRF